MLKKRFYKRILRNFSLKNLQGDPKMRGVFGKLNKDKRETMEMQPFPHSTWVNSKFKVM